MFSVHFMTLFKGVTTTQVEDIMCNPVNFYHVFAAVTCLIIVAIVFYDCYTKKQYAFLMFGAMLLILAFYCADLEDIDLKPNKQLEAVETYIEYGSENYAEVPITPYGEWTVKVPVKIEYCEEHKCVSR